ncbi:hypothetical protein [Eubacterium sp. 1001713B170207_170306_E7]|uniref:hypothetical protein n=1 Tax=Eubacterium sp. 1001713B170207_170306_E7 TaxID=2787097 RepID=UPI00189A444E|nr:hypothetical protein [Eubacterium sp. 1001713B170207_170306_E7]
MNSIKKMLFVLTGLLVFVCLPVLAEETTPKQTTLTTEPSTTVESQTTPSVQEPLATPDTAVTVTPETEAQEENTEADKPPAGTPEQAEDETPTPETAVQEPEDEAAVPAEPENLAEVFVDSNALNSTISIELEDEIVSGPGNKVLAVIPAGARFRMITEPAEGSELMSVNMMVKTKDGAVTAIEPLGNEGNAQDYQMPENAEGISGAVFFGNSEENTSDEAQSFTTSTASDNINKQTIVNSEEKLESAAGIVETADNAAGEQSPEEQPEISETSEAPSTGIEDTIDLIPLFLCTLMIAGVTLWSRKTLN